jgi:hypothetical protein
VEEIEIIEKPAVTCYAYLPGNFYCTIAVLDFSSRDVSVFLELTLHRKHKYDCEAFFEADHVIFQGSKVLDKNGNFRDEQEWSGKYKKKVALHILRALTVKETPLGNGVGFGLYWDDRLLGFGEFAGRKRVA